MLNLLSFWSSETYEGDKISFCVGIDEDDPRPGSVNFFDASKEDYAKVLTSGCDTLLVCNAEGAITSYCEAALPAEDKAAHALVRLQLRRLHPHFRAHRPRGYLYLHSY